MSGLGEGSDSHAELRTGMVFPEACTSGQVNMGLGEPVLPT